MAGLVCGLHVNPEGGVPKHPVESLVVHANGCQGDKQNDTRHHGGPNKAVCLMELRILHRLQDAGHPIGPGTTGENLLIDGLEDGVLDVGVKLQIGQVAMTITGDAPPCKTIQASFQEGRFKALSHRDRFGQTRWYASVQDGGTIRIGDTVSVLSASGPVGNP